MAEEKTEQQIIDEAKNLLQAKDFGSAEKLLQDALPKDQDNSIKNQLYRTLTEWGLFFYDKADYVLAIQKFKQAATLDIDIPEASFYIALSLQQISKYEEAFEYYAKVPATDTVYYRPALRNMGLAYESMNKPNDAIKMYEKAIEVDPNYADAYNDLGIIYNDIGKYDKAIDYYKKALEKNPEHKYATYNIGLAYEKKGDIQKALEYLKSSDSKTDLARAYNSLGNIYLEKQKDYDKALEYYMQALAANPDDKFALRNAGLAYQAKGDITKALEFYEKSIQIDPGFTDAYNSIGNIYLDAKTDPDKAIEYYHKALSLDPNYKFAFYNIGLANERKGNFDKAIEYYNKTIAIDPGYINGYNGLGYVYLEGKKDIDKAIEYFEITLEKDPNNEFMLKCLDKAYERKGDTAKLIQLLSGITEKNPSNIETFRRMGIIYEQNGDTANAVATFNKALQYSQHDDKTKSELFNEIGVVYLNKCQYDEAEKNFEESKKYDSSNVFCIHNMSSVYLKIGRYEEGLGLLNDCEKLYDKKIEQLQLAKAKQLEQSERSDSTGRKLNPEKDRRNN